MALANWQRPAVTLAVTTERHAVAVAVPSRQGRRDAVKSPNLSIHASRSGARLQCTRRLSLTLSAQCQKWQCSKTSHMRGAVARRGGAAVSCVGVVSLAMATCVLATPHSRTPCRLLTRGGRSASARRATLWSGGDRSA